MKQNILKKIEIPSEIKIEIVGTKVLLEKEGKKLERDFKGLNLKLKENTIIIEEKKGNRDKKKLANTIEAHIKNMIAGLSEKWVYKLQICFVHFPTTVEIKDKELIIKNFLGENTPRKARILDNVEVKKEGEDILIVESFDKEAAGQTAANIEKATKVPTKDRRIFQDGIFIIEKAGRKI